ncbi:TRAP transporter large permease subunit [Staphylococcus epidermidis]|nr:TRAP transporter large permease subunit [Staphylococcus epidermidis]
MPAAGHDGPPSVGGWAKFFTAPTCPEHVPRPGPGSTLCRAACCTNVIGCTIFAAVSGSSAATCATIGKMNVPELLARLPRKYGDWLSGRPCHTGLADTALHHLDRLWCIGRAISKLSWRVCCPASCWLCCSAAGSWSGRC